MPSPSQAGPKDQDVSEHGKLYRQVRNHRQRRATARSPASLLRVFAPLRIDEKSEVICESNSISARVCQRYPVIARHGARSTRDNDFPVIGDIFNERRGNPLLIERARIKAGIPAIPVLDLVVLFIIEWRHPLITLIVIAAGDRPAQIKHFPEVRRIECHLVLLNDRFVLLV